YQQQLPDAGEDAAQCLSRGFLNAFADLRNAHIQHLYHVMRFYAALGATCGDPLPRYAAYSGVLPRVAPRNCSRRAAPMSRDYVEDARYTAESVRRDLISKLEAHSPVSQDEVDAYNRALEALKQAQVPWEDRD